MPTNLPLDKVTYVRFEPYNKCIKVDRSVLLLCLGAIGLLTHYILDEKYEMIRLAILISLCISIFVLFITKFGYKPLYGTLRGEIAFDIDKISVDEKNFNLDAILLLDICLIDYYGEQVSTAGGISRMFSRGVGNYVQFTTNSNEEYRFYFQLKNEKDYKKLDPILDVYYNQKKITFKNRYELQRTDLFS